METTPVKPEHLSEYIGEEAKSVNSNSLLFEAMSEMIVKKNDHYQIEQLAELYNYSSEDDPVRFVQRKFDEVVHKDTSEIISCAHRNNWVKYTINGFVEFGVADKRYAE